jgi:uncharacterized membrane protein
VELGPSELRWDTWILVGLFVVSGTVHVVDPGFFASLIPDWLPAHRAFIIVSGVAEWGCAVGMMLRSSRQLAGVASAVLLVAIFPGNVTMAINEIRNGTTWAVVASLARLPVQLPLIRAALRSGR